MSRTAVAKEPQEIYDDLSQDEQDIHDHIAEQGWKPIAAGRGWKADNADGSSVGPFPTLAELESAVFEAINNIPAEAIDAVEQEDVETEDESPGGKLHRIAADSQGNRYLPGTEPVVDSEIAAAAGKYHAIKVDRCNLTTKEVAAKEELIDICHRKKHLFKADPENTNAKIYKVGDLVVRIQNEFKEKVSTEVVE